MFNEIIITLNLLAAVMTLLYIGRLVFQVQMHDETLVNGDLPQHYAYMKRSLLNQDVRRRV